MSDKYKEYDDLAWNDEHLLRDIVKKWSVL